MSPWKSMISEGSPCPENSLMIRRVVTDFPWPGIPRTNECGLPLVLTRQMTGVPAASLPSSTAITEACCPCDSCVGRSPVCGRSSAALPKGTPMSSPSPASHSALTGCPCRKSERPTMFSPRWSKISVSCRSPRRTESARSSPIGSPAHRSKHVRQRPTLAGAPRGDSRLPPLVRPAPASSKLMP